MQTMSHSFYYIKTDDETEHRREKERLSHTRLQAFFRMCGYNSIYKTKTKISAIFEI